MGSTGEATDQDMLAPDSSPIHPRLIMQSMFKPCLKALLLLVAVVRLLAGDLHAVGWGEGP